MSIIASLRSYIATCPHLGDLTNGILVDWTQSTGDYGIMPSGEQPGTRYMDGSRTNQYNAVLYARKVTEADLERLENAEFLENFTRWVEDKDTAEEYPELGAGMACVGLSCANGSLFQIDETGSSGTYMVQLALTYERSR